MREINERRRRGERWRMEAVAESERVVIEGEGERTLTETVSVV